MCLSQEEFGSLIGLPQTTYSKYERGIGKLSAWEAAQVALATDTNLHWLILGEGRQPREPLRPLTKPGAVSDTRPPVADRRVAAAITALADEYQAMNEHGRESVLRRFWKAFPELESETGGDEDRRVAGLSRA